MLIAWGGRYLTGRRTAAPLGPRPASLGEGFGVAGRRLGPSPREATARRPVTRLTLPDAATGVDIKRPEIFQRFAAAFENFQLRRCERPWKTPNRPALSGVLFGGGVSVRTASAQQESRAQAADESKRQDDERSEKAEPGERPTQAVARQSSATEIAEETAARVLDVLRYAPSVQFPERWGRPPRTPLRCRTRTRSSGARRFRRGQTGDRTPKSGSALRRTCR